MPDPEYAILISDALKRQLDDLDRASLRIIREKLEFLSSGLWEGGLRIKKLRGEGRVVFEARMSAGDRLLFTLGRERGRSIIYAWGIEAHDDVARARRSVLPENAPFLRFAPLSIERLSELPADDRDARYFTQEGIEGRATGDYGPQRWRVIEEEDWESLLAAAPGQRIELRLHLSEEQRSFLERKPPLFISGTAGSGKTTLALYYLLRPSAAGARRLFVTRHPNLCRYSSQLYEALVAGRETPARQPRFSTYREILHEIVSLQGAACGADFESSREVDFPAFERMLRERREFAGLDSELAWEEIRGIIKGAAGAPRPGRGGSLLPFAEYQALGRKRAPRFERERDLIYAAALWYEACLLEGGLWDEIDLTRRALEILSSPEAEGRGFRPWDLLVCDEAQDFTTVHALLLLRLVADPSQVVIAGDVKQIIDPSGFRWADLRALFWERGLLVPDLVRLGLNFRSVGGIVEAGNALLEVKRRLAGIQSEETREGWKFVGKSPCLITGLAEESLVCELARLGSDLGLGAGASAAIIVRDAISRDRLQAALGSSLVFTVAESKGLEFDAVLLWNLSSSPGEIAALWRRLAGDDRLAAGREARIVHEINLYYVAASRARSCLVVCEERGDFWERSEFEGLFVGGSDLELLRTAWRAVSSPAQWAAQGEYYMDREYWRAAAECFKNAGDEGRQGLALALFAERRFAEALPRLEAAGLLDKAAIACEETGEQRRASDLWKTLGDEPRSRRCLALALEKEKAFAAAAELWLELGDREAALKDLEAAGEHEKVAALCRSMKLWDRAATAYAACGRQARAALCWRRAGAPGKAADAYYAAQDWERAERCYESEGREERVIDCWLRAGHFERAVDAYIDRHDMAKAVMAIQLWAHADPGAAQRIVSEAVDMTLEKPLHAAVRLSALGNHEIAGELYLLLGERALALAEFTAAGKKAKPASILEARGDYRAAALEIERGAPDSTKVVKLLERHIRHGQMEGRADFGLVQKLNDEAKALEARGELSRAASRYVVLGLDKPARRCLLQLDRDDLAFDFYCGLENFDELGAYIRDKRRFRLSHDFVMRDAKLSERSPYLLDGLARFRGEADLSSKDFRDELAALLPLGDSRRHQSLADTRHLAALGLLARIGNLDALLLVWHFALRHREASEPCRREFERMIQGAASQGRPWFPVLLDLMRGVGALAPGAPAEGGAWNSLLPYLCRERAHTGIDPDIDALIAAFIAARATPGPA